MPSHFIDGQEPDTPIGCVISEEGDGADNEGSTLSKSLQVQLRIKHASNVDHERVNAYHDTLSDNDLTCLSERPYNNEWMTLYGIDSTVLETFVSKHKLESLIRHGALQVGDHLYVANTYPGNGSSWVINKVAIVHMLRSPLRSSQC